MSADFLLELRSEEIPARMQARARNDLARMFAEGLAEAGLGHEGITTHSTPRRLALIARGLPVSTEAVSDEVKGPRTSAPAQALEGFLRKTGLTHDQLVDRDGTWFARIERVGRPAADVLAEAVAAIVRDFPWPKSMRWAAASASTSSLRWVRPLHSIVALLGEEIVPVAIDGVPCAAATVGHRFHHPGPITIGSANDYVEKLRACHVIVDQEEREAIIRDGAVAAAQGAGFQLVEDEGLVVENAGLTEWPVPLLGSFDAEYLDVPEEVIQLTARINQKYFVMRDGAGKLAPRFVCIANIAANDGGEAIIAGNERVLAARLSDARFFWEHDLKIPLEEQAKKLEQIVFHEKLGTVADKVERVTGLARFLASNGFVPGCDPVSTEVAAELSKADLVTGMVGEFPELQGVMGGYYARAEGLSDLIADAIRDHYKPAGQGDEVPTAPITVAVSLADKLDTLASFFAIDEQPTGSKDPFALRRAAISSIRLILENGLRLPLRSVVNYTTWWVLNPSIGTNQINAHIAAINAATRNLKAEGPVGQIVVGKMVEELKRVAQPSVEKAEQFKRVVPQIVDFIADRLKVQQREAGTRHDLIDAAFAMTEDDDIVRLLARVRALQDFVETADGRDLLAGYKRAANILKKEKWGVGDAKGGEALPEEVALNEALISSESAAHEAVIKEDFMAAMTALASLRAPIDTFFDKVTVNDPDKEVRARRLNLLARFRDAVHRVADFSKIEG